MTSIKEWWLFSRAILGALLGTSSLITLLMCIVLLVSALGVVYSAHITRQLFEELTQLQSRRDAYEMEWSQLLLEQSAWSAHGRIEHVAMSKLGMKVPDAKNIVIIK